MKKFKQTIGVLSKTVQLQFHQEIVIKNTKTAPVKITVTDQLPKSSEEKIKVMNNFVKYRVTEKGSLFDKAEGNVLLLLKSFLILNVYS